MEYWDAYDLYHRPLGHVVPRGDKLPPGEYHIVIHAWIQNSRGEMLLQRRADDREFAPGEWFAVGGSALPGETDMEACAREIREEMGFVPDMEHALRLITYVRGSAFVTVFLLYQDVEISDMTLQAEEVSDAKWVSFERFADMLDNDPKMHKPTYAPLLLRCMREINDWRCPCS